MNRLDGSPNNDMSLRFTPESGRQSPFKRQNSTASATGSPSTVRAATPPLTLNQSTSPTKPSPLSPTKASSLSPEKASPFVRRPSQLNGSAERPTSPFGRPNSGLSITVSPGRQLSNASSKYDDTPPASPRAASVTPAFEEESPSRSTVIPAFDGVATPGSPSFQVPSQLNVPSTVAGGRSERERASSTTSTIKAPNFTTTPTAKPTQPKLPTAPSGYNHIPPPLLRSMRESFEVLDTSNTGSVNSASVASMLEQMGMPNTPADVRDFFPANQPAQLNLARYLDILSGQMAELSQSEELAAAFEAFDVDDSGQIDVAELRKALLNTPAEAGMGTMNEREIDGTLGEFAGRRAFGAKGTNVVCKGKGEVFRWKEFMGSITGGSGMGGQEEVAVA